MGNQYFNTSPSTPNGISPPGTSALDHETSQLDEPSLDEQLCDNPSRTLLSGSFLKTAVTASHSLLLPLPRPTFPSQVIKECISLVHVDSGDSRSKHSSSETQEMGVEERPKEISSSRRASIDQVLCYSSIKEKSLQTDSALIQPVSDYILSEQNLFEPATIAKDSFVRFRNENVTLYYLIGEKLGQGGFGVVYRAVCRQTGITRAAKMLKRARISEEEMEKVESEVQMLRQLDHPNILKVYEAYEFEGQYCIITELCEGGSLSDLIRQGRRFSDKAIRTIMCKLMSALAYLHQLDIVHRDVKLNNILLMQSSTGKEDIRLIDFGLAKVMQAKRVRGRPKVGTYTHMAPEVLRGVYSNKCDVWSAGISLCCLATGINPFKKGKKEQTFESILNDSLSFDAPCWRNVNNDLKNLAQRMLTKDLSKRISAAGALLHPFLRGTQSEPLQARQAFEGVLRKLSDYYQGNNLVSLIESYLSYTALTHLDLQQLTGIFRSIDLNGDGFIQLEQLQSAFSRFQWRIGQDELQYLVGKVDKNKSGRIDYSQFVTALSDRSKLFTESSLVSAFRYFDANSSGFLEKEELQTALKLADGKQLQFLLGEMDKDQDHKISQQEFVRYLIPTRQR